MATLKDRLEVCATRLLTGHGFIGTLFSAIEREISDKVPTAGASGNRLFFNPAWCENLKDRELLFICGHEALHVLFKHSYRRMERDPSLANIAQDAVINRMLIKDGVGDVPTDATGKRVGVFIDWVTDEMDWETVYLRLMQDRDKNKEKYGSGGFNGEGDVEPPEDMSDANEAEADIMIQRVISAAKAAGNKSALIDRVVGEAKASRIDWRDELPATIQQGSPTDYSWSRFDRRFIQDNLYLPTMHSESVGRLVIGIDTSGSMTDELLAQIGADVRRIVEDTHPSEVVVIYCDSEINRVDTFPDGTAVELKMYGGGGTDMREIVWHVDKMEGDICACIIFTDGYTPFVQQEPDYPLIWAILGNAGRFKVPAGRVVEVIA